MGKYIDELYKKNLNVDGYISPFSNDNIYSVDELIDYIDKQTSYWLKCSGINGFNMEQYSHDLSNRNLDLMYEKVDELYRFVNAISGGENPICALSLIIINRYVKLIRNLIAKEKE